MENLSERASYRWAESEFGNAQLGDIRRTRRLVDVAAGVAAGPNGKVTSVFANVQRREGAYDLLESRHVALAQLHEAMSQSAALRARAGGEFAYAVVDESSLNFTDRTGKKGFGPLGSLARGLRVMTSLCINQKGLPCGIVSQEYWVRGAPTMSRSTRSRKRAKWGFDQRESHHYWRAAESAIENLAKAGVRAWVVIDRAGDNHQILRRLAARECDFTLRSKADRNLAKEGRLRAHLASQPVLGTYEVAIARSGARDASVATMEVRSSVIWLPMKGTKQECAHSICVAAVWVRETASSAARTGRIPLDWMLYTSRNATTLDAAKEIVASYTMRWKIEEFHRTWKNGGCRVEQCQMRSVKAVTIWASILAANAARIERIKHVSRTDPEASASVVFSETEVEALLAVSVEERFKPAKDDRALTALEVTHWLAQLGGWIAANGPPGSITLARGLDRLKQISKGFELARQRFKK